MSSTSDVDCDCDYDDLHLLLRAARYKLQGYRAVSSSLLSIAIINNGDNAFVGMLTPELIRENRTKPLRRSQVY